MGKILCSPPAVILLNYEEEIVMDTNFIKKEARTERLNFALTAEEKHKIMELAKNLECSASEIVRYGALKFVNELLKR